MTTYADVLKRIHQAKLDAESLELALKAAQNQPMVPGQAHITPQPGDKFDALKVPIDLKVHFDKFNASMKALDFIRNHSGGGPAVHP